MEEPCDSAGKVLELKTKGPDGQRLWAYRYRPAGRDSKRLQRGGFTSAEAARAALERAIKRAERRRLHSRALTLSELADEYPAQRDAQPETTAKLRWLLSKSLCVFGTCLIVELEAREIAHWRMALPAGHRFEAAQALRQVLARAVAWGLLETNPAKVGVDNPPPKRREMLPLEPNQLRAVAEALGPRYGPMVLFAAATGLRPGEWLALEWRDIDLEARVLHVRRAFRIDRVKTPNTNAPRTVPLQRAALDALHLLPGHRDDCALLFPAPEGGHLDLHNWRPRHWRPAQHEAGITPLRRLFDLRHTFATSALRAGLGTFELSRYMGTSLVNIDRAYGHLTQDGHEHAVELLDSYGQETAELDARGRFVDVASPSLVTSVRRTARSRRPRTLRSNVRRDRRPIRHDGPRLRNLSRPGDSQVGPVAGHRRRSRQLQGRRRRAARKDHARTTTSGSVVEPLTAHHEACLESNDCLDALICAVVARATELGLCVGRPSELEDEAQSEGWIHLPIASFQFDNLFSCA